MMQQQMYQQEQPGTQDTQAGHQMVLCPVRVVYETPMLVQQGEQMQPNQTIFINPQNPPPWIQNRAVQNQVIYVQHVPTNYILPQQHIDPNQLYIQNYSYQNMPQMLVQNPQEQIRPMQMTQPHIDQGNTQPGISQNGQAQRLVPNMATMPNTLNLMNTAQNQNNLINRQIAHNQITNINDIVTNIKQENVGQNIYRQVSQTLPQDPRNQMQQTVTLVPNNIQRPSNMYEQSISQMQQMPQQNVANIQNYQNTMMNMQEARKNPAAINKNINYNVVHPNVSVKGPQSFRPIQPRTNQIRNNAPQFMSAQSTNTLIQSMPNMINKNVPRKATSISANQMANTISNNGKFEGNSIVINRKRKSESPDELHKKLSISNNIESPIIIKRIENVTNPVICSDIGVNTSPIHRPDGRITINDMQITPINPINTQNSKIKEELAKRPNTTSILIKEPQNVIRNNIVPTSIPSSVASEKDKLIRNTVYTQARGRVLNDKQTVTESSKPEIPATTNTNNVTSCPVATISAEVSKQEQADTEDTTEDKNDGESNKPNITITPIITDNKPSIVDNTKVNADEIVADDIKLKEDRNFILTHVLDGYVIQESNIAFPIRKPLKEKTLANNSDESDSKELKDAKTDRDAGVRNNSKILNITHLHIKDIETIQTNEDLEERENPFQALQPSVVKTWTAEQLESHLTKFGWNETVSVLQEHEIDGESLLLVSKGQLVTIGVKDEHAEIICNFVKS